MDDNLMERQIADYIVKYGTENTDFGAWVFEVDELAKRFGIEKKWIQEHDDGIMSWLYLREEVIDVERELGGDDFTTQLFDVRFSPCFCSGLEEFERKNIMKKALYTKDELYNLLKNGAILDELLDMSDGQECTIFKADYFPEEDCYNSVIYIPDLDMNGVVYDRKMTLQELADAYTNFYTAQDIIDICEGDEKKAKRVFYNCDWQHPSTEFTEMEAFDEEDDYDVQYYFAETRWCVDDVIDAAKRKGIVLSPQQAEQWWLKNEKWFKDTLTEYGNEILFNADFSEV